jgi:hypothetical protein
MSYAALLAFRTIKDLLLEASELTMITEKDPLVLVLVQLLRHFNANQGRARVSLLLRVLMLYRIKRLDGG